MIKEFGGLRGKPIVKLLTRRNNLIRRSRRLRISGAELHCRIRKTQGIRLPESLRLLFINLCRKRNKVFLYRLTEFLYILFVVAVSLHTVVSKLRKILVSKLLSHLGTKRYQLIV